MDLYDFKLEYTFENDTLAELNRQVALLLSTPAGSLPLDRDFGLSVDYMDRPTELAKSLYTAEATKKVPKFIPAARVKEITWAHSEAGELFPKVVITSA